MPRALNGLRREIDHKRGACESGPAGSMGARVGGGFLFASIWAMIRARPERPLIATARDDFPTDALEGIG
jgi:hypothetical protein